MALIHCDFFSEVLGLSCSMCVILPQATREQIGMKGTARIGKHPTLWLLHGLSDDHTIWQRRTSIERYVAPLGLAVVMPAAHRSFYADMDRGLNYWTFISEELPELARSFFPLSGAREDNFVAGLSMGGYGAFKLALAHPERYAAGASLSGSLDVASVASTPEWSDEMVNIFGDLQELKDSSNDLMALASTLVDSDQPRPLLYARCGTEDFLLEHNRRFRDHAGKIGLDLKYIESPGTHEWGFWDEHIQDVLRWLPIRENLRQNPTS